MLTTYIVRHLGNTIEITGRNLEEACRLANIRKADVQLLGARKA